MKTVKKVLSISSIISVCAVVLMLIMAIFGASIFTGVGLKLLLSFATIALGSALALTATGNLEKHKTVTIIALALIVICSLFGFVIYWAAIKLVSPFGKFTAILGIITILFNIIVSLNLRLGKQKLALQTITYILIIIIDIILTLLIYGVKLFDINGFWQFFAIIALVTFALLCTLSIMSRRLNAEKTETPVNKNSTYELEQRIVLLEEENRKLKEELEKYKK